MFQAVRTQNSDEDGQASNNRVADEALDYLTQRKAQGLKLSGDASWCFLALINKSLAVDSVPLQEMADRCSCSVEQVRKHIKKITDAKMLELTVDDTKVYFSKTLYTYL